MALFSVDIQKRLGAEFWTNRYITNQDVLASAVSWASIVVSYERATHTDLVTFDKLRVSSVTPGDDVYVIQPLTGPGDVPTDGSNPIPLWNVARVDFSTGIGRPSRKYLRVGATEEEIAGNEWTATFLSIVQGYANLMAALAGFVDVDGSEILSGVAFTPIAMRQLRRGSRRRTEPII